jgi:hypothetical protein
MHHRFPHMPFHIVGKEISLEGKCRTGFFEHPATVLVLTISRTRMRHGW